jgi:hypothetical protein
MRWIDKYHGWLLALVIAVIATLLILLFVGTAIYQAWRIKGGV